MSSRLSARKWLLGLGLALATPIFVFGESAITNLAGEYRIMYSLPGEQSAPAVAIRNSSGYLAWQDNLGDANGTLGISARRLNSNLSGDFTYFRVNQESAGEQAKPQVSFFGNGSVAFVWEGGLPGRQQIFGRILSTTGSFLTGDLLISSFSSAPQTDAAVSSLSDGNIAVVWGGREKDGSMSGVFLQRVTPGGHLLGESQVNQFTNFNQRSPAVAGLNNGNFVVCWISEQQRFTNSVDAFARIYNNLGAPLGNEFRINAGNNVCATPALAPLPDGGFMVTWSEFDSLNRSNSLDILARAFNFVGVPLQPAVRVNAHAYGDQYSPRISAVGTNQLVVWTSLGQDGSWEGVYGRLLSATGNFSSDEFRINNRTISRQVQPAVAGDPTGRFLVVWSSFVGGAGVYDLTAQRYTTTPAASLLPAPAAPHVFAIDFNTLSVTWPELAGYEGVTYEIYQDGSRAPISMPHNHVRFGGLAANSSHSFQLAYVLPDGRRSALSLPATGITWGEDLNLDELPDNWQQTHWSTVFWPGKDVDSDGDGASNWSEFLAGTNPNDAKSLLRTRLSTSDKGIHFSWDSHPGMIYQVQSSSDLSNWVAVGVPRVAVGASETVLLEGSPSNNYYRVIRLR